MGLIRGVLRIHIIEAKGLPNKDDGPMEKDVSDPYVTVDVGMERVAKTTVKNNTLNPRWNEVFWMEVDIKAKSVTFKVKDSDYVGSDMLGSLALDVDDLIQENVIAGWFSLICPKGREDCGKLRLEISFSNGVENLEMIQSNIFPQRPLKRAVLYHGTSGVKSTTTQYRSWGPDLMRDIEQAEKIIYIRTRSLNPDMEVAPGSPAIGTILRRKAEEGVSVRIIVQDKCWGEPCVHGCHLVDPDKNLELRFISSCGVKLVTSSTHVVPLQSYLIVDTVSHDNERLLTAYFGGVNLNDQIEGQESLSHCNICGQDRGDHENSDQRRCNTQNTVVRLEGRSAHDILLSFEETWLDKNPDSEFTEIDEEEFDLDNHHPFADGEVGQRENCWEVCDMECTLLSTIPETHPHISSLMSTLCGHPIITVTEESLIQQIRHAQNFVYVESPTLTRDSDHVPPVLKEVVSRATRDDFSAIIITRDDETRGTSDEIMSSGNRECVRRMYSQLGDKCGGKTHPTDHLHVYSSSHCGLSSLIIVDDTYIFIGDLEPASSDGELNLAMCQTVDSAQNAIAEFRCSLLINHTGGDDSWKFVGKREFRSNDTLRDFCVTVQRNGDVEFFS